MKRQDHEEGTGSQGEGAGCRERALNDIRVMNRKLAIVNRKLQEAESLKGDFLANIRNEINNPLTSIMGLANQLIEGNGDAESCRAVASMIYSEAFNLDFQLQNIIQAAELEAGESTPFWSKTDVNGVINRALDLLSHMLVRKNISVKRAAPENLLFTTDAGKFHSIMINLLANATEFNADGGEILVESVLTEGSLRVSVSDSGNGLDSQARDVVFDRFCQVDSGRTKTHRGQGLGLSIVRGLAQLLGGQVWLSEAGEKGCVFTLSLPAPEVEPESLSVEGNLFLFEDSETF